MKKVDKRKVDYPKNKVLQIRCTQEFLNDIDELKDAFGMNRTELIEHMVQYYPILAAQDKE